MKNTQENNMVRVLADHGCLYIDIDRTKENIVCCSNGHHMVEDLLQSFPDYYNPLRDFKPLSEKRAWEIALKYDFFDEFTLNDKEHPIWINDYTLMVCLATLNYIDTHQEFPVVLWPETGMHIREQERLRDSLLKNNITKYLLVTQSIFISGGDDSVYNFFECVEEEEEEKQ